MKTRFFAVRGVGNPAASEGERGKTQKQERRQ
nr:MAG TPA: hypothetical protein [Caudoviricetes sp.]